MLAVSGLYQGCYQRPLSAHWQVSAARWRYWYALDKLKYDQVNKTFVENYLPNQWVFNVFMSKQYAFATRNKKQSIRFSASIRNVLNTLIPLFSFEQSRFDYTAFRLEKFPLKYMYDQGSTYALGAQLQIQ